MNRCFTPAASRFALIVESIEVLPVFFFAAKP
jgi:hypothetical protein